MTRSHSAALAAIALATLVASPALAQSAPPQPPPKVKIEVSIETLNVIAKALGELPLKEAAPILNDIEGQIRPQLAPPEAPAKSKK